MEKPGYIIVEFPEENFVQVVPWIWTTELDGVSTITFLI